MFIIFFLLWHVTKLQPELRIYFLDFGEIVVIATISTLTCSGSIRVPKLNQIEMLVKYRYLIEKTEAYGYQILMYLPDPS